MSYEVYFSQVDAMKKIVEILNNTDEIFCKYGRVSNDSRNGLIEVFNHMIEVRTKPLTDEQLMRKAETNRAYRARKREKRDNLIMEAIKPFLHEENSASVLADKANNAYGLRGPDRISNIELFHFFERHPSLVKRIPPKTEYTFKAWD